MDPTIFSIDIEIVQGSNQKAFAKRTTKIDEHGISLPIISLAGFAYGLYPRLNRLVLGMARHYKGKSGPISGSEYTSDRTRIGVWCQCCVALVASCAPHAQIQFWIACGGPSIR